MPRSLLAFAFAITISSPLVAQQADEAIQGVIQGQLDAFQADDFAKAFTYASPLIQGIFGTSDNFGAMVKNGYPMVWRPGTVKYLELREVAGGLYQTVAITDQAGRLHMLEYEMIPVADGWEINGVQILQAPDIGA